MSKHAIAKFVAASPERTFEAFTDFHGAAETVRAIKAIEVLGDGKIGVGTRFRETRLMFKKEATEEMEITAFERPRHYAVGCESCGCEFTTTFDFVAEGDGTRVDVAMEARPISFLAKMMSPLGKLMMGSCMKQIAGDLDDMAAVAEGRAPAPETAALATD